MPQPTDPVQVLIPGAALHRGRDPARRCAVRVAALATLAVAPALSAAQTIADYSRSQRVVLEATMSQNAARAAALVAPAASAAASTPGTSPPAAARARPLPPLEPTLRVSGVFASAGRSLAEVGVDGASWLLAAGQPVPGTPWHVASITPDRVVLARATPAEEGAARPATTSRTFLLAAPR